MDAAPDRRQRLFGLSAIVLKRRDLGEADRLLTVFTRDRGKLQLLAKGVRRQASRKAGHIEPFTYVRLLVAKGASLDLVTQAETVNAHRRLREDLLRSSWAYYIAELADAFTQDEDPNAHVFDLLLETLGRLDRGDDAALVARYYELRLLSLAGFQPQLFRCLACEELLNPETNFFSAERGGALCPRHGANQPDTMILPLPALKVMRFLQTRPWDQIIGLHLSSAVSAQVETIMGRYIVYHLERGLRSTAFLDRLRRNAAHAGAPPVPQDDADEIAE